MGPMVEILLSGRTSGLGLPLMSEVSGPTLPDMINKIEIKYCHV